MFPGDERSSLLLGPKGLFLFLLFGLKNSKPIFFLNEENYSISDFFAVLDLNGMVS